MLRRSVFIVVLLTLPGLEAENWLQFRGPTGLGYYTSESSLPSTWGGVSGENVIWKAPLTGAGHASPVVWNDRVFVSKVLATNDLGDPNHASPAVAGGRMFLAGTKAVYCVGKK